MSELDIFELMEAVPGITGSSSAFQRAIGEVKEIPFVLPYRHEMLQLTSAAATLPILAQVEPVEWGQLLVNMPRASELWSKWRWTDLGCIGIFFDPGKHWDVEIMPNKLVAWESSPATCEEDVDVSAAIVRSYSLLQDVTAIYIDRNRPAPKAWVFLGKGKYDGPLMDSLLREEKELLGRFLPLFVSFTYPPDPGRARRRDTVGREAELVYER